MRQPNPNPPKPAGGIKIRVETISHYLGKYSQQIIQRKLSYLSPNCPLTDLPAPVAGRNCEPCSRNRGGGHCGLGTGKW